MIQIIQNELSSAAALLNLFESTVIMPADLK
jgi:hypothetical protein